MKGEQKRSEMYDLWVSPPVSCYLSTEALTHNNISAHPPFIHDASCHVMGWCCCWSSPCFSLYSHITLLKRLLIHVDARHLILEHYAMSSWYGNWLLHRNGLDPQVLPWQFTWCNMCYSIFHVMSLSIHHLSLCAVNRNLIYIQHSSSFFFLTIKVIMDLESVSIRSGTLIEPNASRWSHQIPLFRRGQIRQWYSSCIAFALYSKMLDHFIISFINYILLFLHEQQYPCPQPHKSRAVVINMTTHPFCLFDYLFHQCLVTMAGMVIMVFACAMHWWWSLLWSLNCSCSLFLWVQPRFW